VAEPVTPTPLRAAFEARDHDAIVAALAPDVVLRSPIFEVPFTGIDEASDLFAVLSGAGRVGLLGVAGAPAGALMRATAATGPRLLGLSRSQSS
jgi:hypothetical protein